jgi:hypothetical protein
MHALAGQIGVDTADGQDGKLVHAEDCLAYMQMPCVVFHQHHQQRYDAIQPVRCKVVSRSDMAQTIARTIATRDLEKQNY